MESPFAPDETPMSHHVLVRRGPALAPAEDELVIEEPLEIRLNDRPLAVTMRTPGQDRVLAVGFLATEGILRGPEDLYDVTHCADPERPVLRNVITVYVAPERCPSDLDAGRQRYAASGCGLCGRASIESVQAAIPPVTSPLRVSASLLSCLPERLREAQPVFRQTGGLHAAGLFDREGRLLFAAEDIGRHNAVDKAVGQAFLGGEWPLRDTILMTSGRAGFEIVQKAAIAGIPAVCSVSAPSSLSVDLARETGMLLVGFLRGERFNVYAGVERILP
jgi:FdhD protein